MSNNRSGFLILEYVTVAGSVIGSAIALFSQQVIYGLAPVSLSLLMNLINRRQLEQQIQQSTAASSEVQQLKSAINTLSLANAKLQQDVQNIAPNQELTSIASKIEELNQQQNGLRLSLVPLQSRLDDLAEQFNKRPELEQIESLATVIMALKQCIDGLAQPEQLQMHSVELQHQVEKALAQVSTNSQRVERVEKAIAQVQQQLLD